MIGLIIKQMRINSNLSQIELSKMLSVAQTTLSGWERGYREPTFDVIEKIATICDYKINFTNNKNKEILNTKNITRKIQ